MTLCLRFASFALFGSIACSVTVDDPSCKTGDTRPQCVKPDENPVPPAACRTPAQGDMFFSEITSDVGLAKTDSLEPLATGIVPADLDGDGWTDFFAAVFPAQREPEGTKRTRFLFMNRPDPNDAKKRVFVESLDDSGLLATRDGEGGRGITAVAFGDLDNDGDLDAIGCGGWIDNGLKDGCAAFLNDGKAHFAFSPQMGDLETDLFAAGTISLLDYDNDGVLDAWPSTIGQWQYGPAPTSRMRLYKGAGDGTFADVSAAAGLPQTKTGYLGGTPDYRMIFGVRSCDVDLDGDRDVILSEYGVPIGPNHLYRNDDGKFVDVGKDLGIARSNAGGFTFDIACGDIDDDGDMDLFTAELHHAWYADNDFSELLRNDTPKGQPLMPFVRPGRGPMGFERPHVGMQWTEGDAQSVMVDVDLDGRKDVFVTSVNYPQQNASDPDWTHDWLYQQKSDGTFEDATKKTPFWDKSLQTLGGVAFFDIDNDGDLDLVTGTSTYNSEYLGLTNTIHAFRNDIGQSSNMARIRVAGKSASNASGFGARVEVKTGGHTQMLEVQSDVNLTFGLGGSCVIDEVVVHWPDAAHTETHYKDVPANYLVTFTEGMEKPKYAQLDGTAIKK